MTSLAQEPRDPAPKRREGPAGDPAALGYCPTDSYSSCEDDCADERCEGCVVEEDEGCERCGVLDRLRFCFKISADHFGGSQLSVSQDMGGGERAAGVQEASSAKSYMGIPKPDVLRALV